MLSRSNIEHLPRLVRCWRDSARPGASALICWWAKGGPKLKAAPRRSVRELCPRNPANGRNLDFVNARRSPPLRLRERDMLRRDSVRVREGIFCHACRAESLAVHPDGRLFPCGQTLATLNSPWVTYGNPTGPASVLAACRPPDGRCRSCDLVQACPGDCPSRLYYNSSASPALACELYRTLWQTMNASSDEEPKQEVPDTASCS